MQKRPSGKESLEWNAELDPHPHTVLSLLLLPKGEQSMETWSCIFMMSLFCE